MWINIKGQVEATIYLGNKPLLEILRASRWLGCKNRTLNRFSQKESKSKWRTWTMLRIYVADTGFLVSPETVIVSLSQHMIRCIKLKKNSQMKNEWNFESFLDLDEFMLQNYVNERELREDVCQCFSWNNQLGNNFWIII